MKTKMKTDISTKLALGDLLLDAVCKNLELTWNDDNRTYICSDNTPLLYGEIMTIALPDKICADNEISLNDKYLIDAIVFFNDGTIEFHNYYDNDAINWCEFDISTITIIINELIKLNSKKNIDTHIELIYNKMHSVLKHTIEKRCINHFKAFYCVYDKRLTHCNDKMLKLSYIENKHLYIESCYNRGVKCGQCYSLENIIIDLIGERDYNAIFYDACNNLSEDSIIRNSMRSNSNYFEYVLGYIKDVYNIPKINGYEMVNAILAYFGLGEDFDNNFNFNILKKI